VIRIDVCPTRENPSNTTCMLTTSVHVWSAYASYGQSPYMATIHVESIELDRSHCSWENENTFCYYNFLQIATDFELFQRFWAKAGLTELCSHRLIATLIANPLELRFRHKVLHSDLQPLHYDLIDMHKLSPQIDEVMAFLRRINVNQYWRNFSEVWKLSWIALFWPLKQLIADLNNFCGFAHL
jgi:hypothetical protein